MRTPPLDFEPKDQDIVWTTAIDTGEPRIIPPYVLSDKYVDIAVPHLASECGNHPLCQWHGSLRSNLETPRFTALNITDFGQIDLATLTAHEDGLSSGLTPNPHMNCGRDGGVCRGPSRPLNGFIYGAAILLITAVMLAMATGLQALVRAVWP